MVSSLLSAHDFPFLTLINGLFLSGKSPKKRIQVSNWWVPPLVASVESYAQVCKDTGVSNKSLRDWERAFEAEGRERPATKEELAEIRRLKRELKYAKEDAEILKKAMGLFAKEPENSDRGTF